MKFAITDHVEDARDRPSEEVYREVSDLVRYFRDGFAFQNDIWDPARADATKKRALLVSFLGARFRETLLASLGFVTPVARAGCSLGDLRDAPCS